MSQDWQPILNFLYIFLFMALAKLLKEKLGFFRSIIIPTALLAGFLGLACGPEGLGLISFDIDFYTIIVIHFMGFGFISLTLASTKDSQGQDSVNAGLFIVSNYVFQGILGMIVVYFLSYTFWPDLFPGLGLMLPLGFGQGPGFASSIGNSWDQVLPYGFINQYGLTLATTGFLVGGLIGVVLLNFYVRKYNLPVKRLKQLGGLQDKKIQLTNVAEINFFDTLTVQFTFVAIAYAMTYITMKYTILLLGLLGPTGETIASLVKGFNFLFGILMAMVIKNFLKFLNSLGHRAVELVDSFTMQNITSFSFNIMITASVMAISISAIKQYWILLVSVATIGAIGTWLFVTWLGKKVFKVDTTHYILAMFGMLTGTASTGLALLRGIDPDLETDVAKNLVLGSAIATPLGLPLMAMLGFPIQGYLSGQPIYSLLTLVGLIVYLGIVVTFAIRRNCIKS